MAVHEYDIALKSVLRLDGKALAAVTGVTIERWHNVELPGVRARRADLIGETSTGLLVHIELQSRNDPDMALRMADYALDVYRQFRRFPRQFVLYVGEAAPRMETTLAGESVSFGYRLVDIRDLDAEPLLASELLEDNIVAVLMRLGNERQAVRRILQNIAESEPARRGIALRELAILAGLRNLGAVVGEETTHMPILDDLADHDLFGPVIRRERAEGLQEGRLLGEQVIVRRQIGKRFGPIPAWAEERLGRMSASDLEDTATRLLDARSLEELLG